MKIGIISDTHDNVETLKIALEKLREQRVARIFHCGDVCRAGVVHMLTDFDLWIAQGNMDRHFGLAHAVEELMGPGRLAWLQRTVVNGYGIAMIHGDHNDVLRNLITSGQYAYVLHGHTHQRRDQTIGHTRVINPGALGGTRKQSRSFCILDLETDETQFIELA